MSELQVTTFDNITNFFLLSTYGFLPFSKSRPELPQMPVVSRYFVTYLTSFVAVAPFFRTKDPRVASRTNTFFNKALDTLADVEDKDLNVYLKHKATAWCLRFPPIHSPDSINDTKEAKDHEGPEEADTSYMGDAAGPRPMLSGDED